MSALDVQVGGEHYKNGGIQPVEFCESNSQLSYCQTQIIKYAYRLGTKGGTEGTLKDAEKIKHYVDLFLELNGYLEKEC